MITNTKVLFSSVLKALEADCVCDIGSRDGDQALLFRHLRPTATVLAFEANPINFGAMISNNLLRSQRVDIFPYALTNAHGTARFHITDVDYTDEKANKGTSSLLLRPDLKIKESVEVETQRIDEFILTEYPQARVIGLWIDVEGAEFDVLEGMAGLKDRVIAVHVETAKARLRESQRTLAELVPLMESYNFMLCGSNMRNSSEWGDVVFVSRAARQALGFRFSLCKLKGYVGAWLPVDHIAVLLKSRFPSTYRCFRKAYLKLGM